LSVPLHHHLNSPDLLYPLILAADEFIHEEVLANHYTLFIDNVIKFAFFLFDNILLIILFIVIIIVFFVVKVLFWLLLLLLLLISLVIQLIQDILDLTLELFVTLLHEILQDFRHAKLFGLFS